MFKCVCWWRVLEDSQGTMGRAKQDKYYTIPLRANRILHGQYLLGKVAALSMYEFGMHPVKFTTLILKSAP